MKPWQRIVGSPPHGGGGSNGGGDSRAAFDDLRRAMEHELEREPDSPLLVRTSLEALLGAFATRAQQRRGAIGLVAFELEDWKTVCDRAGAPAFESAFADFGRELRRRVRASDEVGRLGEGQMAAILPGCEAEALASVSERLRQSLEAREVSLGTKPTHPGFATAWLAVAPGPSGTRPGRLLEELSSALERARAGASG